MGVSEEEIEQAGRDSGEFIKLFESLGWSMARAYLALTVMSKLFDMYIDNVKENEEEKK